MGFLDPPPPLCHAFTQPISLILPQNWAILEPPLPPPCGRHLLVPPYGKINSSVRPPPPSISPFISPTPTSEQSNNTLSPLRIYCIGIQRLQSSSDLEIFCYLEMKIFLLPFRNLLLAEIVPKFFRFQNENGHFQLTTLCGQIITIFVQFFLN